MPSHNYPPHVLIPILAVCYLIDPELARTIVAALVFEALVGPKAAG